MDYFLLLCGLFSKDNLVGAYHYLNEASKEKDLPDMGGCMARMEYTMSISWMIFDRRTINWIVSFLKRYSILEVFEI